LPRIDPATLAEGLPEDAAFIGYRVFTDSSIGEARQAAAEARHLGAFVLLRGRAPSFIDLGPLEPIESAVAAWRETVAARTDDLAPGSALTSLVIRPLLPLLANTRCWWIAADHALHFVPLDALPIEGERIGDRLRVVAVPSLVRWSAAGRLGDASAGRLLAIGGVEYGDSPDAAEAVGAQEVIRHGARFDPLANTRTEASEIVDLFTKARGPGSPSLLLGGEQATRDAFFEEAPASRFLHLATHGYFEPGDGLQSGADHAAWVELDSMELQGVAPMTLCGIALAGANAGRGVDGHFTGIVTAQELASLDLSRCELAVLSACETHLGVVRRGVGVESLQKALHAAGVRSSVTSLWRVSDDATRELMGGFYRALWVEGRPAAEALWRAKQALRLRRAPVADWAGWVLSESP
jgi:CHAT domain-containing protein